MKNSPSAPKPMDYKMFDPSKIHPNGQMSLFPTAVAKSQSAAVRSVFGNQTFVQNKREIDDTYKKNGKDLPIQTRVVIEYSQIQIDEDVQNSLNRFDWEVMDAISTLFTKPGAIIDLDSIYRVIVGKKNMYPVTPLQHSMVDESIEKMRRMSVEIRIIDLFEKESPINAALREAGIRTGTIRNYLLPCEIKESEDRIKGSLYQIRLLSVPPLFLYAKTFGLASVFPLELIDTPLTKTRDTIILQSFLLRAIDQMYRDRDVGYEFSNTIETSEIYSLAGNMRCSDPEKMRTRRKTEQLLSFWEKEGYIAGYNTIFPSTGRKIILGYRIFLSDEKRFWELPSDQGASPSLPQHSFKQKMQEEPDELAN